MEEKMKSNKKSDMYSSNNLWIYEAIPSDNTNCLS